MNDRVLTPAGMVIASVLSDFSRKATHEVLHTHDSTKYHALERVCDLLMSQIMTSEALSKKAEECIICGKIFVPQHPFQMGCSDRCQELADDWADSYEPDYEPED